MLHVFVIFRRLPAKYLPQVFFLRTNDPVVYGDDINSGHSYRNIQYMFPHPLQHPKWVITRFPRNNIQKTPISIRFRISQYWGKSATKPKNNIKPSRSQENTARLCGRACNVSACPEGHGYSYRGQGILHRMHRRRSGILRCFRQDTCLLQ